MVSEDMYVNIDGDWQKFARIRKLQKEKFLVKRVPSNYIKHMWLTCKK